MHPFSKQPVHATVPASKVDMSVVLSKGKVMNKNALLSVYHKDGIVEFAQALVALGWKLYASGGTAKTLAAAGVPVTDVAELVGGGAILGHRVVTLSREVHAGLMATTSAEDLAELESLGIPFIDLVCVDMYPLAKAIAKPDATTESVIKDTDVGGPTMLRSGAKGRRIVICDPDDRQMVLDLLQKDGDVSAEMRETLAAKVEAVIAGYCLQSTQFHSKAAYDGMIGKVHRVCKYGENASQAPAALYSTGEDDPLALDKFTVIQGTDPSYNNYGDIDRLLQTFTHIAAGWRNNFGYYGFIAVGVKHGNACGVGISLADPAKALRKMIDGNKRALMGGLIITNFGLNAELAEVLLTHGMEEGKNRILDGIVLPEVTEDAIAGLKRKGDKCRLIINPALNTEAAEHLDAHPRIRQVRGGFLKQPNYTYVLNLKDATNFKELNIQQHVDLMLAWAIGCTSNSNTITIVKDGMLIGNGVGQQDRVGAAELAIKRAIDAGHSTEGASAYSDSFFPFDDGPEVLAKAGISAILSSSGSQNDKSVIQKCIDYGVTLCLIPDAILRGFFGH